MDGTQKNVSKEDVSTAIFDITHTCLQSFDQIVANYDDSMLTKPMVSSDDTTVGRSQKQSTYDFLGLRNSFLFWIDYTGALSLMSSSLDARLQGLEDISAMVVELLEMILRNLQRVDHTPDNLSVIPASPTRLHLSSRTWEDALHAIQTALDRLHFIAVAIRKASAKQLGHSVTTFVTDEDIFFRRDITTWVRYRFPAARKALCQQLGDSIAIRREILLQAERRAKRLAVRREPSKAPSATQHSAKHPHPQMRTEQQLESRAAPQPSILVSRATKASRPDPHSPALQILHRPKQPALTTVISTISTSHDDEFNYPPVPKATGYETWVQCPFCFRPLERKAQGARDDHWRHHIDEHIEPYGCLFPQCAKSQLFFLHRNQWKAHMESAHSGDWLRKVHTIVWYCDIDHDAPETFETELQWREHMQNLDSHPKRKLKTPTQAQLDALSPRKQQMALRDKFVCPLCEQIPEKIQPLVEKGQNTSEMHAFVVDHVANHLKSLSLMAVPSFDTAIPETPGAFEKSLSLSSDSFKRPMRENSIPQPPSGREYLDEISLHSETWANLDQDAMALVSSTRQNAVWDKEYSDYMRPEDLAEPSEQEWLEVWKSWRNENDPFSSNDSRADPILLHFIEAKNTGPLHLTAEDSKLKPFDIDKKDETGRTALSIAAGNGDTEALQRLLSKGAGLEVADEDGRTPLSWAASSGHEQAVQLLLDMGARVDAADQRHGQTPLSWAASNGHEAVVGLLIGAGAEVDAADIFCGTPLSWAVEGGHGATVKLLLECGADVGTRYGEYNHTPLSRAAERGDLATVKLLLECGADVKTRYGKYARTPLSRAAENGHETIVKLLLECGADVQTRYGKYARTPLSWAAENGHETIVKLLLECGADVKTRDREHGRTPLSWAAENGHETIVKLLLECGADAETRDGEHGRTPLSRAAENGHETIVKLLLECGADVETRYGEYDYTPLSRAAERGDLATVKLLLECGADVQTRYGKYARTPLSWAAENGHETIVKLLLECGADVETLDGKHARTPLSRAAENGHEAVVWTLLKYKGDVEARDQKSLQTPLMLAAENGHVRTVSLLLQNGALLDAKDREGRTALDWATEKGQDDVVKHLLRSLGGTSTT
ncbi:ankyrin repeat-containing domain protein [Triangularia verruculosa]|uniref:Ankyrin repeat-containing domain protein n=1 Tax=Triangularia verruculosa TaxID=2587418 RepID=A0AAN7AQB7_9PEZI|nr:ankyrin repeat-containing domain protein [Triangularia verruculosa]